MSGLFDEANWAPRPQAMLGQGPAPSGRDRVFDNIYGWLGGKPENRWAADKLTTALDWGTLGMLTGAYDGGRELAETGRPASLATAIMPGARVAQPMAQVAKALAREVPHTVVSRPGFDLVAPGEFPLQTGLQSRMWGHLTTGRSTEAEVPVSSIRPLQPPTDIEPDRLARYIAQPPPRHVNVSPELGISLYRDGEVYYTIDGHHRVEAARKRGDAMIDARVRDIVSKAGFAPSDKVVRMPPKGLLSE